MAAAVFYIPAMFLIFAAAATVSDLIEYFTRCPPPDRATGLPQERN